MLVYAHSSNDYQTNEVCSSFGNLSDGSIRRKIDNEINCPP